MTRLPPSPPTGAPGLDEAAIHRALEAVQRPDEVISPILPLPGGPGWPWPEGLAAGVLEPRKGYRFRPENQTFPVVLGRCREGRVRTLVDLGAGTGSLLLAGLYSLAPARAVGLEIQPEMADRLTRTLAAHGRGEASVLCGDLREADVVGRCREWLGRGADLVVTNPPFFPEGWGQPSAQASTRRSTHALAGGVADFLGAARSLLAPEGRIYLLYDAGRMAEALAAASDLGLPLLGVSCINDTPVKQGAMPYRVWLRFGSGGLDVERI